MSELRVDRIRPTAQALVDCLDHVAFSRLEPHAVQRTATAKLREMPSLEDFGAVGDWNPVTQTGTDDTAAIVRAFASVPPGTPIQGSPGKKYRITSTLTLAATTFYGNECEFIKDFAGVGIVVMGWASFTSFFDCGISASTAFSATNFSSTATEHGLQTIGSRVRLDRFTSNNHRGAGVFFDGSLGNSNKTHVKNLWVSNNSFAGVAFEGGHPTPNNTAVLSLEVVAYGNFGYAFYCGPTSILRASDVWLYTENNCRGAAFPAGQFGVHVLRCTGCSFWVYSEELARGLEIFFGPDTRSCHIYSLRRNGEVDNGSHNMWQSGGFMYSPNTSRASNVSTYFNPYARNTEDNEFVGVDFAGTFGTLGGLAGVGGHTTPPSMQLRSPNRAGRIGISDQAAFSTRNFSAPATITSIAAPTVAASTQSTFGTEFHLFTGSITVPLFTLPAAQCGYAGFVMVSCEASGGVSWSSVFCITTSNSAFAATALASGASQGAATAALELVGGVVRLVFSHNGALGPTVRCYVSGTVNAVNH